MTTTTEVESYFKIGDTFVLVDDYDGALPDEDYVEGAISCRISGQAILGQEQWDLVDQLWAYIVEGLVKLSRNEVYESTFPDQPLRLRLEPISAHCVRVTIGDDAYNLDRSTFVAVMTHGAKRFFAAMKKLHPQATDTWDRYLGEVTSMKA